MAEPIMVGMRLRPLVGKYEQGQPHCVLISGNVVSVVADVVNADGGKTDFAFDAAMDSTDPTNPEYCDQEKCYKLMGRRMLEHMLQGFNTALFCYGQTGTGKTTTIMGKTNPPSEQGLLLRLITEVFEAVGNLRQEGHEVLVKVQMLEVYNEKINDLIAASPDLEPGKKKKVDVHVHPELGVYLTGATEAPVNSAEDTVTLIEYGNTMKTVAATAMNSQSSRGHTVFKLNMEKRGGADNMTISSEVYFADLAGRENEKTTQVKGERLVELSFINRSLMWLANCIQSLGNPANERRKSAVAKALRISQGDGGGDTMPRRKSIKPAMDMGKFRNSKLTLLLSNALSGNSRTAMIGTLSPAAANFDETYSTLKFASTVKSIKLEAKAATGVDMESLTKKLQAEVLELKRQLSEAHKRRAVDSDSDSDEVASLSNKLQATEAIAAHHSKDWPTLLAEEGKIGRNRILAMEKLGKSRDSLPSLKFPYLANYSDDPHLAFTLVFHVPPDQKDQFSIGYADGNDFILPAGLGISDTTCYISNQAGVLKLRPARVLHGGFAKVEVNSVCLSEDAQELKHLDCVLFGHSIRFFTFLEATSAEALNQRVWSHAQHEHQEEITGDALLAAIIGDERAKDPVSLQQARQYCNILEKQNLSSEGITILRKFLHSARFARKQVEEANDITKNVRPSSGLRFDLVTEAPVLSLGFGAFHVPELCVRLVQKNAGTKWGMTAKRLRPPSLLAGSASMMTVFSTISADGVEFLSVWSWPKFCERLELMHLEYAQWSADPVNYKLNPLSDPWAEYGPSEMAELQQRHHDEKDKAREHVRASFGDERQLARDNMARLQTENGALQQEIETLRRDLELERRLRKPGIADFSSVAAARARGLAKSTMSGAAGQLANASAEQQETFEHPAFVRAFRSQKIATANRVLMEQLFHVHSGSMHADLAADSSVGSASANHQENH